MSKLLHIGYYNLKFIPVESFYCFVCMSFTCADLYRLVISLNEYIIHWFRKGWSLESYLVLKVPMLFINIICVQVQLNVAKLMTIFFILLIY